MKEYILAIAALSSPGAILCGSRISNSRVCVSLDFIETADTLVDVHQKIEIQDVILPIRHLITRDKCIVLFNVCLVIPHYVIEDRLVELGIQVMSQIIFVKLGMNEPVFSHVLSFRRQVSISPDDIEKLSESFQVYYEDTNYWTYTLSGTLKCFIFGNTGHIVRNCKEPIETPDNERSEDVASNDLLTP